MAPALFHAVLFASLALCALGLAWRASTWLRMPIGRDAAGVTPAQRAGALLAAVGSALVSRRGFALLGEFCLDALLLRRLFAKAKLRALAHLLVLAGFALLVLTHALAPLVAARLFPGYQPTLEPWLFLRNLGGALTLAGLAALVIGRRRSRTGPDAPRRPLAAVFVALLGLVLVSGFLLEAHKIASPHAFARMTAQFAAAADPVELAGLRALWSREFGVAFAGATRPADPALAERGRRLHEAACASCHAQPASAFVSWPIARLIGPAAALLDQLRADAWLLHLHLLACLVGLATLPFTSFLHAVAAPSSLLVAAAARHRKAPRQPLPVAARATRRVLALDACVRCGLCDRDCSVAPLARHLGNPGLLPAHKLVATGALARGGLRRPDGDDAPSPAAALRAADGAFLCTDCGRCTAVCPVGLDLADLWAAGRADLEAAGLPASARWVQAQPAVAWAESLEQSSPQPALSAANAAGAPLSHDRSTFARCVQCQTCTNVCPVVAHGTEVADAIDLTPQKVMNLLRLGLPDLALGSRMVWGCATCYQCQEHCPEGIRVTDIMCELRALAVQRLGSVRGSWGNR